MTWDAKFFTLAEMTVSDTAKARGINNVPTGAALARLNATARRMDKVRMLLGHPVIVTSGYRSPALNKVIGGVDSSHHTQGYAVDFKCPKFGTPLQICKAIEASGIKYDQLIQEFGQWVHISFAPTMRGQELTAVKRNGKTVYVAGLS